MVLVRDNGIVGAKSISMINASNTRARVWISILSVLFLLIIGLNVAGYLFKLFTHVSWYDEVVHFLTPFVIIEIASEAIYRNDGDDEFFGTRTRALLTGAAIGFFGEVFWEIIEAVGPLLFPELTFHNPPIDTVVDVVLGIVGGAAGAGVADLHLDSVRGNR